MLAVKDVLGTSSLAQLKILSASGHENFIEEGLMAFNNKEGLTWRSFLHDFLWSFERSPPLTISWQSVNCHFCR